MIDMSFEEPETQELLAAIRDLHLHAGKPSTRSIASTLGSISHTTVAQALNGSRLPTWPVCADIVNHLGGDEEKFRTLWVAARRAIEARALSNEIGADIEARALSNEIDTDDEVISLLNTAVTRLEKRASGWRTRALAAERERDAYRDLYGPLPEGAP